MSDKNTDKELSMDEMKDVSGGGMGLDRLGTQKTTGKMDTYYPAVVCIQEGCGSNAPINNDKKVDKTTNVIFPGNGE